MFEERQAKHLEVHSVFCRDLTIVGISNNHNTQATSSLGNVYSRTITAQMGRTVNDSARMTETRYELVEEFSDFKTESGLTLPHTYKIRLSQQGTAMQISEWLMTLVHFNFNQSVDAKDFDVSGE